MCCYFRAIYSKFELEYGGKKMKKKIVMVCYVLAVSSLMISCAYQKIPRSHMANRRTNCIFCHNPDQLATEQQSIELEDDS